MKRFAVALFMVGALLPAAYGDTVIVDETFDNYVSGGNPDQAAFQANWRPDNGDGIVNGDPTEAGLLVPDLLGVTTPPNDNPPELQGIGVNLLNGINESVATFSLLPSATQSIRFGGDFFNDGTSGTMRQSIGLRNDNVDREPGTFGCQCGLNFIELGFYNTNGLDPADGTTVVPNAQFQFRIALFDLAPGSGLVRNPDWLSFQLDPALDEITTPAVADYNDDGTVNAADYSVWRDSLGEVVATPGDGADGDSSGTIDNGDFDLWKTEFGSSGTGDGIVKLSDIGEGWHRYSATITPTSVTVELDLFRNGVNEVTGQPGVDASATYGVQLADDPANPGVLAAFNSLRIGPPSGISGNYEAVVDNVFLTVVDVPPGSGMSAGAVPEPAAILLSVCAAIGLGLVRRRR